eukprot:ANDGO_07144.mRNA.1 Solute carrier family 40 member 1
MPQSNLSEKTYKYPFLQLIVSHGFTSFGDRMFAFSIPLLFLHLFPESLLIPAIHAFSVQICLFIVSPSIGNLVDTVARLKMVRWSFAFANVCASISALFLLFMAQVYLSDGSKGTSTLPLSDPTFWFLFSGLLVFAVLSECGSTGSSISVLKDWTIVIVEDVCRIRNETRAAADCALDGSEPESALKNVEMQSLISATDSPQSADGHDDGDGANDGLGAVSECDGPSMQNITFEDECVGCGEQTANSKSKNGAGGVDGGDETATPAAAEARLDSKQVLSNLNAVMRRVDLSCDILAPLVFSIMLETVTVFYSIVFVILWNLLSLPVEYGLLAALYKSIPTLASKNTRTPDKIGNKKPHPLVVLVRGIRQYHREPIFRASFGYVWLYMTSLSPGVMMVAYLAAIGTPTIAVAVFRGLTALFGLLGTILYPWSSAKTGVVRTGVLSISAFCFVIGVAACTVIGAHVADASSAAIPYILMLCIITSRSFLWCFDLAETQIMQTRVDDSRRGLVNGVETCLSQLFSMVAFVPAMVFSSPDDFYVLCIISMGAVCIGTSCFVSYGHKFPH